MSLVQRQYDNFVFELKYRPKTLDEVVLPDKLVNQFNMIKSGGDLPNMLFSGPPGVGKTTTAFVLADDMDLSAMYMNMSLETGIDGIRTKMMNFATAMSIDGRKKVIIGDEFDRLSPQAMDSLKGVIEKTSKNCKFIFTSNHKAKIIDPIISRLQEVDFIFSKADTAAMKKKMWRRACQICQKEEVVFDKSAIAEIVRKVFPDMRKIINQLQMFSLQGDITLDVVNSMVLTDTDGFFKLLRDSDWTGVRQYIVDLSIPINDFYTILFQNVERYLHADSVSEAIVLIDKYNFEGTLVSDKQIPLAALAIEMMNLEYKKDF